MVAVAQSVEHQLVELVVAGSIPVGHPTLKTGSRFSFGPVFVFWLPSNGANPRLTSLV